MTKQRHPTRKDQGSKGNLSALQAHGTSLNPKRRNGFARLGRDQARLRMRALARFLEYSARRFQDDSCPGTAASLSYSSLLALVPLLAMALGLFSAFPAFSDSREAVQDALLRNFLPDVELQIEKHLNAFVANASQLTAIGVLGLFVVATLLLSTITDAFNRIWRVREPRPLMVRMVVYWTVLTLGPLIIGASLSLSTYGLEPDSIRGVDSFLERVGISSFLPVVLTTIGFSVLFLVVPSRPVRLKHAVSGALVAAVLFEGLKWAFALFVSTANNYQAIYGALSTIPIFLIWMYLSWTVVLFGAEVAASMQEWHHARRPGNVAASPGARLALALSLLRRLRDSAREGQVAKETQLTRGLPASLDLLSETLYRLRRGNFVVRTGSRWVLARDLSNATFDDLLHALRLHWDPGAGWPEGVEAIMSRMMRSNEALLQCPVADILEAGPESGSPGMGEVDRRGAGG